MAELASRIFGAPIPPDNVIGETLRRATEGDANLAALAARLAAPTPASWDELRTDPLAVWAERTFGLRENDDGRLSFRR